MKTFLFITMTFVVCACSPGQIKEANFPTKYPATPTMGDVERASAGTL
jgi:hypothetical protein